MLITKDGEAREHLSPEVVARKGTPVGGGLSVQATRVLVGEIMDGIRRSDLDTIALFVHGGLVTHKSGYEKAKTLAPALIAAGHYPIFAIWDAGWASTTVENLVHLRQGQRWQSFWGIASAPAVLLRDLGSGVLGAPLTTTQQALDYCTRLKGLFASAESKSAGFHECGILAEGRQRKQAAAAKAAITAEGDSLLVTLREYRGTRRAAFGRTVSAVVTFLPKLVTGPIIDGIGTGTYHNMRRRTVTMFRRGDEFVLNELDKSGYRPPSGAFGILADSLSTLVGGDCEGERTRCRHLHVTGHSMGAIVLARLLSEKPSLRVDRINFLSAAASMRDIEESIVPYMRDPANANTKFFNAVLHPRVEAGEWQPKYLDLVPRGSLLEWIDDYLTDPVTPLERTAGKWSNIASMQYVFPAEIRQRIVIKGFGFGDPRDAGTFHFRGVRTHGSFSDARFRYWDDTIWCDTSCNES